MVYFTENESSSCRVFYSSDGMILKTVRYYKASELDPYIRCKVTEKYKGKDIISITEVSSQNDHYYEIVLQNSKTGCKVKYEAMGAMTTVQQWRCHG